MSREPRAWSTTKVFRLSGEDNDDKMINAPSTKKWKFGNYGSGMGTRILFGPRRLAGPVEHLSHDSSWIGYFHKLWPHHIMCMYMYKPMYNLSQIFILQKKKIKFNLSLQKSQHDSGDIDFENCTFQGMWFGQQDLMRKRKQKSLHVLFTSNECEMCLKHLKSFKTFFFLISCSSQSVHRIYSIWHLWAGSWKHRLLKGQVATLVRGTAKTKFYF